MQWGRRVAEMLRMDGLHSTYFSNRSVILAMVQYFGTVTEKVHTEI